MLLLLPQVVADRVLLARLVLLREELRALAERTSAQDFWGATEGTATPATAATAGAAGTAGADSNGSNGSSSSSSQPFFAFHRSNLPARCAAFLKNLLGVPDRNKRLGLLTKVCVDWGGGVGGVRVGGGGGSVRSLEICFTAREWCAIWTACPSSSNPLANQTDGSN